MRFAYLDESGIGDSKKEPFVVVAGVIVHADRRLKALEKYLRDMAEDFVRPEDRAHYCFHAKHLYNGGGVFDRQRYQKELRHRILRALCETPGKFNLPVVMGYIEREHIMRAYPRLGAQAAAVAAQAIASTGCAISIERYMRQVPEEEVASLVYENNDQAKKLIRETHNFLRTTDNVGQFEQIFSDEGNPTEWAACLPLTKIVETAFFAEKTESSVLQVADAVVFAINRKLRDEADCEYFFAPLANQLIVRPRCFGESPPKPTV